MKLCAWCGRENEDSALACPGCGTNDFRPAVGPKEPGDLLAGSFSEHDVVKRLRWLAVLPAALVGSQALYLLARLAISFGWPHFFRVVSLAIYGPAFVLCGSYTAPRARTVVAIVLTAVNFLSNAIGFLFFTEK